MKKIIALALVFILCLGLAGCGKNSKKFSGASAIEGFVKSGTMTDCEFSLGDGYADVLASFESAEEAEESDSHEHPEYSAYENDNYKIIETIEFKYYFADEKLVHLAAFGDAYGFAHGSVITELKSQMDENGYTADIKPLSADDAFFLYGMGERESLQYKFGDNTVMFVFEENALCATLLSAK